MGSYEEEYRKYYSDAKAKLNIKSEIKANRNKYNLKEKENFNLNSSDDIYPKSNYFYNKEDKRGDYIIEDEGKGTYKGIGTYNGINNYNNQNSYRGIERYNGRFNYGQGGGYNLNGDAEEKNILKKWGKRIIIELVVTLLLFTSVLGIKNLPYKEAKTIYTACKEIVSTNFDYKNLIDNVRSINVIKEVDKIKESFKVKPGEINTFKPESNDENIDDITSDEAKESTD